MEFYQKTVPRVLDELDTSPGGLAGKDAGARLERCGRNVLVESPKESRLLRFLKHFTEFIILVLIGAAIIAGLLGEWVDSIAIMAIVALNGVIGFTQEEKAERVMEALKRLSAPQAKVLRGGELETISASELVPGDMVSLDAGDKIPADLRIVESNLLRVEEAALTGESHPVDKDPGALENTVPLGDRINMAYMGTTVVYGRGRAVVTDTGMATEMGKIAAMLQEVKREPTPLQRRLAEFARILVYLAGAICALIFFIGVLRGDDVLEMFLTAVSLAVAAIPEGLPAVVTIVLALGVQRMVKRHALVKKLPSVETLGAATVVASDKTGTLTENQMTVRKLFLSTGESLDVTGSGYEPGGEFFEESKEIKPLANPVLTQALKIAALCNSSELKQGPDGKWQVIGDPTEGALLSLAQKAGLTREEYTGELTFTGEVPFDAERKMMTTVFRGRESSRAYVKGAPERILSLCTGVLSEGGTKPITDRDRETILAANEGFARGEMRVLALAFRESKEPLDVHSPHTLEKDLTFVALAGMIDPPREEVFVAVEKAKAAGITPIMITGDHSMTAVAIAKEIGAFHDGDVAVTGEELDRMSEEEFTEKLSHIRVYARVNPAHKLKVVRAWKQRGEIIAMTGDGINDAPALKEADIGVAMGITGTDVTKEASDMVLTDDNFASIVSAVEEGRGIFDNIRRVVHFLLSCGIAEIMTLFVAVISGMPLPLLPVQILWMNLVTNGLPALGLAMEPIDPAVMDKKPRASTEGIVTGSLMWVMALQGVFIALVTLGVYAAELYIFDASLEKARTMVFIVLVYCQMFHVFNCRSEKESVFRLGPFTNGMLNLAVATILFSQGGLVYVSWFQPVFKVVSIGAADWALVFAASVQPLVWMEIVKWWRKIK